MSAAAKPQFERAAILGVGMIGSSIARTLKRNRAVGEIVGCEKDAELVARVQALRICDKVVDDPAVAVEGADLVILATPVSAYEPLIRRAAPRLANGAIVTDVGSVKQAVIRDLGPLLPEGVEFVPGHPIAGIEKSGPEVGFAELFQERWWILTPPPGTDERAVEKVAALWRRCGSMIEVMDAGHHDQVLAITSHLPHLIAYTIVGTAVDLETALRGEVIKFSASGFRDFTRIAGSDPIMWRDIFLNNKEAVLEMLQRFSEDLTALQRSIRWGEGERLEALFRRTREIRQSVLEAHQAGTFDPREPERVELAEPVPEKASRPDK
ncbi:MAG: prephenate/arogenate dehydrogenase family protein [Kiloniellales bacterium]